MDATRATPPVTPELVRWAYRLLLGREPESELILEEWSAAGDFAAMREGILASVEFASNAIAGKPEQGAWAEEPATGGAVEAMLLLRDAGARPDPAEVAGLLAGAPTQRALRRSLLGTAAIEAWLPRREGLRRRTLRLGGQSFVLSGDSRDPEFQGAPGAAHAVAAFVRALWPDDGEGRGLVDAGAGIGLGALAMVAGAPDHAGLRLFETGLPRVAMLVTNVAHLPRVVVQAVPVPPLGELLREGPVDLLRLGMPEAAATLAAGGEEVRAAGATVLLRFNLGALLVEGRADPRAVLRRLVADWPAVASLADPAEPALLRGEDDLDGVLRAALADPFRRQELVLTHDTAWLGRYSLVRPDGEGDDAG
jgi:hypothetical protein